MYPYRPGSIDEIDAPNIQGSIDNGADARQGFTNHARELLNLLGVAGLAANIGLDLQRTTNRNCHRCIIGERADRIGFTGTHCEGACVGRSPK